MTLERTDFQLLFINVVEFILLWKIEYTLDLLAILIFFNACTSIISCYEIHFLLSKWLLLRFNSLIMQGFILFLVKSTSIITAWMWYSWWLVGHSVLFFLFFSLRIDAQVNFHLYCLFLFQLNFTLINLFLQFWIEGLKLGQLFVFRII